MPPAAALSLGLCPLTRIGRSLSSFSEEIPSTSKSSHLMNSWRNLRD